jgi:hypothetical protein
LQNDQIRLSVPLGLQASFGFAASTVRKGSAFPELVNLIFEAVPPLEA